MRFDISVKVFIRHVAVQHSFISRSFQLKQSNDFISNFTFLIGLRRVVNRQFVAGLTLMTMPASIYQKMFAKTFHVINCNHFNATRYRIKRFVKLHVIHVLFQSRKIHSI